MSICSHEKQVLEREKEREGGGLCYVCIHTGPPSIIIPNTIPLSRFHKEMIYIMLITIIHCSLHYYNCRSTSAIYNRLNVIVIIIVITTNTTTTMNREQASHTSPTIQRREAVLSLQDSSAPCSNSAENDSREATPRT